MRLEVANREIGISKTGEEVTLYYKTANLDDLNLLTQPVRGWIIQDILGHPNQAPSLAEFHYMNPEKAQSTIQEHLDVLIENGLVRRLERDQAPRNEPSVFYTITDHCRTVLEKHNIYIDDLEEMKDAYQRVEKPEKILRYEQVERPTG